MHNILRVKFDGGDVKDITYRKDKGGKVIYTRYTKPSPTPLVQRWKVSGEFTQDELDHIEGLVEDLTFVSLRQP